MKAYAAGTLHHHRAGLVAVAMSWMRILGNIGHALVPIPAAEGGDVNQVLLSLSCATWEARRLRP